MCMRVCVGVCACVSACVGAEQELTLLNGSNFFGTLRFQEAEGLLKLLLVQVATALIEPGVSVVDHATWWSRGMS